MKYSLHFKTDDFSYIAVDDIETREEAIIEYKRLATDYKNGSGVPDKEWRETVDEYLTTGKLFMGTDCFEQMSPAQRWFIHEIQKSRKRTKED